jgi:hypothetical protein
VVTGKVNGDNLNNKNVKPADISGIEEGISAK